VSERAHKVRANRFINFSRWRHRGGPDDKSVRDNSKHGIGCRRPQRASHPSPISGGGTPEPLRKPQTPCFAMSQDGIHPCSANFLHVIIADDAALGARQTHRERYAWRERHRDRDRCVARHGLVDR